MKTKTGFKLRPLGNDFILIGESLEQVNFNKMISLNETAAYLWQQLSDGNIDFDAQTMANLLTKEYDVDDSTALRDAQNTIDQWLNAGIIE